MATLTFAAPTDASEVVTPAASAPAGDKFVMSAAQQRKDTLLIFDNGHSAPITVTIAGIPIAIDGGRGRGNGTFTPADRVVVVPNGSQAAMIITSGELQNYLDEEGELNLVYTSGNAALTVLGFSI